MPPPYAYTKPLSKTSSRQHQLTTCTVSFALRCLTDSTLRPPRVGHSTCSATWTSHWFPSSRLARQPITDINFKNPSPLGAAFKHFTVLYYSREQLCFNLIRTHFSLQWIDVAELLGSLEKIQTVESRFGHWVDSRAAGFGRLTSLHLPAPEDPLVGGRSSSSSLSLVRGLQQATPLP